MVKFLLLAVLCCLTVARGSFDLISWNNGKFIFGVDYYPEAWPSSMWEQDAQMMQKAGINFVRLAEFTWVKMEPTEGQFDFTWLDSALAVLSKYNISAILGTPTAAPPAWLIAKFPEMQVTQLDGVPYRYGSRCNRILLDTNFINATKQIVAAMAQHFNSNPSVLGYQLDNEVGGPNDYSPMTQAGFQAWLQTKYQTLDNLNSAWGTVFWSQTYMQWSEIPIPWNTLYSAYNPSLYLDFYRFNQDITRDFLQLQVDIIRSVDTAHKKAITTNMMGLYEGLDYADLSTVLDFSAWDNYPLSGAGYGQYWSAALGHDLIRSTKKQNFIVMEQQGGVGGWNTYNSNQPNPEIYRIYAYQAIAHGADGVSFFRWRTSRYGTEQHWQGVLDADSYPNTRYQTISRMGNEIKALTPKIHNTTVVPTVAILLSSDSEWAFTYQQTSNSLNYLGQIGYYALALLQYQINIEVISPVDDFTKYQVILAPSLYVVTPSLYASLENFTSNGGILLLSFRSGFKDENNVVTNLTLPGPFATMAGVAIHEFDPDVSQGQSVEFAGGDTFPATVFYDILTPTTAKPLATYTQQWYSGSPAITMNSYNKGQVFYVGCQSTSMNFYQDILSLVAKSANIQLGEILPMGVEVSVRKGDGYSLIFILNYSSTSQSVNIASKSSKTTGVDLLTNSTITLSSVQVGPTSVLIIYV